ncbi:MAG: aminoacyl-tRNA hydrolase [Anaerolineaceae bacterium]|nr:aminoacyl-tRNA hydrolase [Anaerolineaceae bacterium]
MLRRLFQRGQQDTAMSGPLYLIIGLGNPGREYRESRHNIGFMVVDHLCEEMGITVNRLQSKSLIGTGIWQGRKLILAKPQTFMNLSGQAVAQLVRFYKTPIENLLVIHDDLDLPLGTLRMRPEGGAGGQKGLASIIQSLGTQQFSRLRIGIGRPPGRMSPADYVLQKFSKAEQEILPAISTQAGGAVQAFLVEGLQQAMNRFNGPFAE